MKNESCFVPFGQYIDSRLKIDPVEQATRPQIREVDFSAGIDAVLPAFPWAHPKSLVPAEAHQNGVGRQAVQPRRKCRLPAKRVDLEKEQDEYVLGGVLSLHRIS
jgi:hypothetical protein